jgi:uncharacterized membrane protein YtjA (UPF0391 family)
MTTFLHSRTFKTIALVAAVYGFSALAIAAGI